MFSESTNMTGNNNSLFDKLKSSEDNFLYTPSLDFVATHIKHYFERDYFKGPSADIIWFHSHGLDHTLDIQRNANLFLDIISKAQKTFCLNNSEIFVLFASTYYQHTGLFYEPTKDIGSQKSKGIIRIDQERYENENTRTFKHIQQMSNLFYIDDVNVIDAIGTICVSKSYDEVNLDYKGKLIDYLDSSIWEDIYSENNISIRPKILYLIWNMAHILSTSQKRIPEKVKKDLLRGKRKERFQLNFWLRNYCVKDITVSLNSFNNVCFTINLFVPKSKYAKENIYKRIITVLKEGIEEICKALKTYNNICIEVSFEYQENMSEDLDNLLNKYKKQGINIGLPKLERINGIYSETVGKNELIIENISSGKKADENDIAELRRIFWTIPDQPHKVQKELVQMMVQKIPFLIEEGKLPKTVLIDRDRGGPIEIARLLALNKNPEINLSLKIINVHTDEKNVEQSINLLLLLLNISDGFTVQRNILQALLNIIPKYDLYKGYYNEILDNVNQLRSKILDQDQARYILVIIDSLLAELYSKLPQNQQRIIENRILHDLGDERFISCRRDLLDALAIVLFDASDSPNQKEMFNYYLKQLRIPDEKDDIKESIVNNLIFLLPLLKNGQREIVKEVFKRLSEERVKFGRLALASMSKYEN